MPDLLTIRVNGKALHVASGTTVAAAILRAGQPCRVSVSGEPRTAVCGMGICMECRAMVDGIAYRRTCQMFCEEGMCVETGR